MSTNFPARPVIIKLTVPEVQAEFERQRHELELNAKLKGSHEPLTNEMFIAYLLDIRKAAMEMKQVNITPAHDLVDEHAQEILGHDDPEPKGTVN
jgi:hypothetical protein